EDGGPPGLAEQVAAERHALQEAERDRALVAQLEELRTRPGALSGLPSAYRKAFAAFGVDLRKQTEDEVVHFLQGRSAPRELLAALDVWLLTSQDAAERQRLRAIAARLDSSGAPSGQRFRALIARRDWDGLKRLAASPEALRLPATDLPTVGLA